MVPIHDSDIAEERWSKAEWEHYELWEKIEVRLRRRKWFWISGTVLLFLILSSVPIVLDHWPKWTTLSLGRKLAQELNSVKREASFEHVALRFYFTDGMHFRVEKVENCSIPAGSGTLVREGVLAPNSVSEHYSVLQPQQGMLLGIPGLINQTCYDALKGSDVVSHASELAGFGIIPNQDSGAVKNLSEPRPEARIDRLTVLFLKGNSAEFSLE